MSYHFLLIAAMLIIVLLSATTIVLGDSDPCPGGYCKLDSRLIPLNSTEGYKLLLDGKSHDFFQMVNNFESQDSTIQCGLGSLVTVLNSLYINKPPTFCLPNNTNNTNNTCFKVYTQTYVKQVDPCSSAIIREKPNVLGLELDQVARIFQCFSTVRAPITTTKYYYGQTRQAKFKQLLEKTYQPGVFLIANYQRGKVYQEPWIGAHYSPLAAYNKEKDKVLILDVARFKYPPVWVNSYDIIAAVSTNTTSGLPRGILAVSAKPYPGVISINMSPNKISVNLHLSAPVLISLISSQFN